MTVFVIRYDPETGKILTGTHHADHAYTPGDNELVFEEYPSEGVRGKRVNPETETLIDDPEAEWDRLGVVDVDTRDFIGALFREKGSHALGELNQIEDNPDIPSELTAYLQDVFAMQYLTYVALTGDRVSAVESRFFNE